MSSSYNRLAILIGVIGIGLSYPGIRADDAPADPPAAAPAEAAAPDADAAAEPEATSEQEDLGDTAESILTLIMASGVTGLFFMATLGLFSLFAVSVACERLFSTRRARIVPSEFGAELRALTRADTTSLDALIDICRRFPVPAATILQAGLTRTGRAIPEVEKSMEDAAVREMSSVRAGIKPLHVVGNTAPLIGLLGTVVGMIIAFRTTSQSGLGKGELLAQGIYMALVTTAAGLSIAIPAVLSAAWFSSRVERLFREIDVLLMETMPWFARMERTNSSAPSPDRNKSQKKKRNLVDDPEPESSEESQDEMVMIS